MIEAMTKVISVEVVVSVGEGRQGDSLEGTKKFSQVRMSLWMMVNRIL
jgi:hypothetical protein